MDHEIKNGEMIHREANGNEYGHSAAVRCPRCPAEPSQSNGTWKASAWFADPTTGLIEQHEVTSTPDVVAAWLRALADRADPPRPNLRQEGYQQKRGDMRTLGRPTP